MVDDVEDCRLPHARMTCTSKCLQLEGLAVNSCLISTKRPKALPKNSLVDPAQGPTAGIQAV